VAAVEQGSSPVGGAGARGDQQVVFHVEGLDPERLDLPAPPGSTPSRDSLHLLRGAGPRPGDVLLRVARRLLEEAAARSSEGLSAVLLATLNAFEAGARSWVLAGGRALPCRRHRPLVMGVLNVTPDSFSDGGRFLRGEDALAHGERLAAEGADLLDVGGESTRPGSRGVGAAEELERVLPVVEGLARRVGVPLCVDTTKAAVAAAALAAGAAAVNDTSGLADDPAMVEVLRRSGAGAILMHRRGVPRTMQEGPEYQHCVAEVASLLRRTLAAAVEAGIRWESLVVDPGIGFGKRLQDNVVLVRDLAMLRSLGVPVLLGASRKSFLGKLTGREAGQREPATHAATAAAFARGVELLRVHDVAGCRDVLRVLGAIADD
jgi:dihydropteroate synthase